jgi:hypothetical protein
MVRVATACRLACCSAPGALVLVWGPCDCVLGSVCGWLHFSTVCAVQFQCGRVHHRSSAAWDCASVVTIGMSRARLALCAQPQAG